jgi:hypothetical protein
MKLAYIYELCHIKNDQNVMKRLLKIIDKQIEFNQGKNIFLENLDLFQFTDEIQNTISNVNNLTSLPKQFIVNYLTDKSVRAFCRVNQYYSFDSKTKSALMDIYSDLFDAIQTRKFTIDNLSKLHYENLKMLLQKSNPFAIKLFNDSTANVHAIPCSEYRAELQINILQININRLTQPVLDIGCGSEAHLVNHFKNNEIEAYGIDRFNFSDKNLINSDWLEYSYGEKKWGTIVSNLGFSNHFNHHNLREDGNYLQYAKTYKSILNSLKIGGQFHYAPDLPFIEKLLDNNHFYIKKYNINELNFKTTVIKRLK